MNIRKIRKVFEGLFILILSCIYSFAPAQSTLTSRVYGTANDQIKVKILKTNAGDYIISCTTDAANDSCLIVKIDANLNTIWSKQFGYAGKGLRPNDVFEKDNGNLLIALTYYSNTISFDNNSANLLEIDASGVFISMDSIGKKHDRLKHLIKTNDGNFINYGELEDALPSAYWSNLNNCVSLIKYNMNTGAPMWNKFYNYNPNSNLIDGEMYGKKITEDSNDSLYILSSWNYKNNSDMEIRILHTDSLGNHKWVKGYNTGKQDRVIDMIIDANDNNYILGYTNGFGSANDTDLFLLKIGSNGQVKWIKSYRSPIGGIYASTIISGGNNKIMIVGYTTGGLGNLGGEDAFFMEVDSAGNLQWAKIYGDTLDEQGLCIAVHPNGFLLAGTSNSTGFGGKDIYLINTDSIGNVVNDRCTEDVTTDIIVTTESITTTTHTFTTDTFSMPFVGINIDTNSFKLRDTLACPCCCLNPTFIFDTICNNDSIIVNGNVYDSTGVYSDTLTDINACDSIITTILTVLPELSFTNTLTICFEDSVVIGGTAYSSTGIYTDTLQASTGCDSINITNLTVLPLYSSTQNSTLCDGQSITVGNNTYNTTGTFYDTLISSNGCDSVLTTNILILPNSISIDTISICQGDSIIINGNTYASTGIYIDTIIATNGCDSIITTILEVYNTTALQTTSDTTIMLGGSVTLLASGSSSYLWSTGSNGNSISVSPEETTTYFVTGTDTNGCTSTQSVTVTITMDFNLYVPNAFSPSSNKSDNKRLYVFGKNIVTMEFAIYDRWGEIVFQTSDVSASLRQDGLCCKYGKGWNGTYENNGKKLNSGVFAYKLIGHFVNGEAFVESGNITLIW